MVEIDIQPTKDRNFICMHDETLERTSTGVGAIKDYTTEELKKLVLRSGNVLRQTSDPTLEEFSKFVKTEFLSY
jgi:glycerophosphoryl diester phosphodiesterase